METNTLSLATAKSAKLPFPADEKNLSMWLASLATSQSVPASQQVLQVVQAINGLDLKADLKIKFLLRIYNFLPIIVEALQKTYLDKSLPLVADAQQNVDRVINIYLAIAQALHINLITHPSLGKEAHVLSLHLALDVLALALLNYSFGYHQSMPGLWQQCYSIYVYAELDNLLQATCKYPTGDTPAQDYKPVSIETKFKHLLLYFLCDTQQFRAREQQMVFRYLLDYAAEATITNSYQPDMQQASYAFNLKLDKAPHKIVTPDEHPKSDARFIYCLQAAKKLHASIQQKSITSSLDLIYHDTLLKAASSLGLTRKRKYTRIKKSGAQQGIIGFSQIIEYMRSRNIELALSVPQDSTAAVFDIKPRATFDLVPLGDEVAHQMRAKFSKPVEHSSSMGKIFAANSPILGDIKNSISCDLVILDSSVKGYGLTTNNKSADVKIGDILGLAAPNSENLEISLIRRINQLTDQNLHIGVEILSFKSELAYVSRKNDPSKGIWAIFIPKIDSLNQASCLIFNGSLISSSDIICVKFSHATKNFAIQKTLITTPAIAFVQLVPEYEQS